ncbi:unnamed protein product, partial [Diplocarpon coronariae]
MDPWESEPHRHK